MPPLVRLVLPTADASLAPAAYRTWNVGFSVCRDDGSSAYSPMRGEATRKIVAARTASWLALRSEGRRSHGRGILYRFMDAHHWGTHQTPQRARRYTPISSVRMAAIESPSGERGWWSWHLRKKS